MADRIDNFSYAWNGSNLDWDVVFGADFNHVPAGWATVYKPCSFDELVRVARQGVSMLPEIARHSNSYREFQAIDRHRSPRAARLGVRRSRAIFALPSADLPHASYHRDFALLEMRVDQSAAFVADTDALANTSPFGPIKFGRGRTSPYKAYWAGLVSLADFKKNYVKIESVRGHHWACRPGAPTRLPQTFFSPEVLVMTPTISQRHVRILRRDRVPEPDPVNGLFEDEWEDENGLD